ncbi:isoleucine--tRNA ligase [Salsipaludibacter albus]|uniref:isoleucine--tRNA ligase n=1 Tax=Salsipaludibacter albus TaxID=2849650 RepID=UPI001EE45EAF|nr:isoleucine--tRNA ligase [Salsipaludibacter albus]MBY5161553.1 isoleucine--tRNA ligase [Salsipaludibacter albus]
MTASSAGADETASTAPDQPPARSDGRSDFTRLPPTIDLPATEQAILELWDDIDAFEQSVQQRPADDEYVFYDGPPFANGTPHYGHLLASTTKDVVPRYWTMRGHRIHRRWGWDTHGLPVEMKVEEALGVRGPAEIEEFGVAAFNEACRALVDQTADDWDYVVRRLGRWVDMDHPYRTMDTDFMESVWWVFDQLWDKGLVYRSVKVLPYSWGATTPLSNFEANLDYRMTDDPSIVVRMPVVAGNDTVPDGDDLLIWTTTPWTLPGNLAIGAGRDVTYARVRVDDDGTTRHQWLATDLVETVLPDGDVVATASGADLLGVQYQPPFDHFGEERDRGAFRVLAAEEVETDEGTGLVHMAPAYGEIDFLTLREAGLDVLIDYVDADGRFTELVPEVAGVNIKEADSTLLRLLGDAGLVVSSGTINHSYPFCYRTGTPLIYKAVPTWFVEVTKLRDRLVELNHDIHWVPEAIGEARFGNWLEGARDWAVSRNRYWGSCIPVWECEACERQECLGSIDELEERSGQRPDDLHKHVLDPITYPCPDCDATMRRVPEVLDCWFESGSMPYAQLHYPFDNVEQFEATFPAEFISESLDQTRGWFYTLHVLSTALFDSPSFRNCVVSGMILAEDGRKMSKSLKNYPDPGHLFDSYGADALRAYMMDSPLLRAEPLRFSEAGVRQIVRTVLLPLWNVVSFFTTYAEADGVSMADLAEAPAPADRPEIDRWVLSVLQSLVADVNREMEGYHLNRVVTPVLGFIEDLTNWYVRRSRRRFWRSGDVERADTLAAFATLYESLTTFARVLAPVLPFLTEHLHQVLEVAVDDDAPKSIHWTDFPQADESLIDTELESAMATVRSIISMGRHLRTSNDLRVRQPLRTLTVITRDPDVAAAVASHAGLVTDELNVREVVVRADEGELVSLTAKPNFRVLGPRLGAEMGAVAGGVAALSHEDLAAVADGGTVEVAGHELGRDDLDLRRDPNPGTVVEASGPLAVALDTTLDRELEVEGLARDLVSRIQQVRRDLDLDVSDRVVVGWASDDEQVREAFARHGDQIASEVLAVEITADDPTADVEVDCGVGPVSVSVTPVD